MQRKDIAALISAGVTRAEAAAALGVSVKTLNAKLKQLGMFFPRAKRKTSARVEADVNKVAEFIIEHGGTIIDAATALNIQTSLPTLRKHLKAKGVDLSPFKHANRRFGSWKVLPSPTNCDATDDTLLCQCQSCGSVKKVSRHSLSNNRSKACMKCASALRQPRAVVSSNGLVDFKSIREFVAAFDLEHRYQSVRLKLNQGKSIAVNGCEYTLQK